MLSVVVHGVSAAPIMRHVDARREHHEKVAR
jgi:hypothetical protein